ncbi:hypothetical protein [Microbacterium invictum]|uniref:Uncharacterized protein n=1 Tax=Microbacterium invictum TaxID=515415 RepID=A0AA40SLT1_9MICO|nr:hypothetical protein [Microbacterium invictum]MBB4138595.1 hypothetical protein [Microbacterium invictum]
MSTGMEQQPRRERSVLYTIVVIALVVLGVVMFATWRGDKATAEAETKAAQLIETLEGAGADVTMSPEAVARVLGTSGGATCADPNGALSRSTLLALLSNGAGGPGIRPVLVDSRLFQGQLAIIEVYCPDELDEFREFVDSLQTTSS